MEKISKLREISKELEKKVLACILIRYDKDKAVEILTKLKETDFQYYSQIYNLVKLTVETNNSLATILIDKNISWSEFLKYDVLDREWKKSIDELRRVGMSIAYLEKTQNSIEETNYQTIEENIASHISDLSKLSVLNGSKSEAKEGVKNYQKYEDEVKERISKGEEFVGMETGYRMLDNLSEGILPRSLTVIGGYSGAGKTSLCLNIMANILKEKKRVVMFSLEMGAQEIYTKLIALEAELNPMKMLKGFLKEDELNKKEEAKAKVYEMNLGVYDDVRDMEKLRMLMIKEALTNKPDLFVIDYLQMINSNKYRTMIERMSAFPNELKDISKSLDIPIIAISSISNDSARSQNDEVGGYKGSGDIEFAADLAIKLLNVDDRETRDVKKKERRPLYIDLSITKQRHGVTGTVKMSFQSYIGKFLEGRI